VVPDALYYNVSVAVQATKTARSAIATIIWIIALLCAVVLGLGALLTVLDANQDNAIVSFVDDLARRVDGPFWELFTFSGKGSQEEILVNWGVGAMAYLIVGRIIERIIRPLTIRSFWPLDPQVLAPRSADPARCAAAPRCDPSHAGTARCCDYRQVTWGGQNRPRT